MHQNGVAPFWYFMSNNNIMTREGDSIVRLSLRRKGKNVDKLYIFCKK